MWVAAAMLVLFMVVAVAGLETSGGAPVGRVRPRPASDIGQSPWSVGAETMDRNFTMFSRWQQYLGPLGAKRARIQSGWARTEVVLLA